MPDIKLIQAQDAIPSGPSTSLKPPLAHKSWNIRVSPAVERSKNPIRVTLAHITAQAPSTSKPIINLGLGDPTHYPLHPPPPGAHEAVSAALLAQRSNGYLPGPGSVEARRAVADYHAKWDGVSYLPEDIALTHGVGHALDMVFSVLCPPPSRTSKPCNVLLPQPGFSQYAMLLDSMGVEYRHYPLLGERDWAIDLERLEALCDDETRAIVLTNPSNPCGSNYSEEHLRALLDIADRHKIPIVSDEIYAHMTWGSPFHPIASLSTTVPVLTLGGLSKRFLLPGWRFGWVALHDPLGVASDVRAGLGIWANRIMGPNSLVQAALPKILDTPAEWHQEVIEKIRTNADIVSAAVQAIAGLSCSTPTGALYMLVKIDPKVYALDDVEFCTRLYREEAVFVLPGMCFDAPGYFRVVLATPADVTREVGRRLVDFCSRYGHE